MDINGGCHCGNITFLLRWHPRPAAIIARKCDCSFCVKHGGVWTSAPGGQLRVSCREPQRLSIYCFGTATADFYICSRCGVPPLVTSRIDGRLYAGVNVNTFESAAKTLVEINSVSFEKEALESRLARRKNNWIADVVLDF